MPPTAYLLDDGMVALEVGYVPGLTPAAPGADGPGLALHLADLDNPHEVTIAQIGAADAAALADHLADLDNPHELDGLSIPAGYDPSNYDPGDGSIAGHLGGLDLALGNTFIRYWFTPLEIRPDRVITADWYAPAALIVYAVTALVDGEAAITSATGATLSASTATSVILSPSTVSIASDTALLATPKEYLAVSFISAMVKGERLRLTITLPADTTPTTGTTVTFRVDCIEVI